MVDESRITCIECGTKPRILYLRFDNGITKLRSFGNCHSTVDEYLEYDFVVTFLNLLLHKKQAFRHILFNVQLKSCSKLLVLYLLADTYCKWSYDGCSKNIENEERFHAFNWHAFVEMQFYIFFFITICEHVVYGFMAIILIRIFTQKIYQTRFLVIVLIFSNYGKLFNMASAIWAFDEKFLSHSLINIFIFTTTVKSIQVLLSCRLLLSIVIVLTSTMTSKVLSCFMQTVLMCGDKTSAYVMKFLCGFITTFLLFCCLVGWIQGEEKEELAIENELNENSVIALNEVSPGVDVDSSDEVYHSHTPTIENAMVAEDLMTVATPGQIMSSLETDGDEKDIIKRSQTFSPSFSDIYGFISSSPVLSDEKENILTATATSNVIDKLKDEVSERRKRNTGSTGNPGAEMKSIFTELKTSKHHKLTRSDIRQLAKKAVMLATLKKLNEDKKSSITDKHAINSSKPTKKQMKKKHSRKTKRKHKSLVSKSDLKNKLDGDSLDVSPSRNLSNEMSEDLSRAKTKSTVQLSDDAMSKTEKDAYPDADSESLMSSTKSSMTSSPTGGTASTIEKKSSIAQIDKSVENIFDDDDDNADNTKAIEQLKDNAMMNTKHDADSQLSDKVTSIKTFLQKADPAKIPIKFLPDLPVGLRMIGWKELIEKKKKQLGELETDVGVTELTDVKPVTVNIDVDQDSIEKETAATDAQTTDDLFSVNGDKKHDTDPISIQHVGYLQRHIKGARALRKLIAKTLVGHCKSTGQRILDAFVAMDKALARAQTIASVIGKKFNIDPDRIDALVGDKEDQVVETFLKDIFTKI